MVHATLRGVTNYQYDHNSTDYIHNTTIFSKMSALANPSIPKGSLVLVTGVNGWMASHVADQFLKCGYKVRGTVRSVEKSAWVKNAFDAKYGSGNFELAQITDFAKPDAFTEALKGE